MPNNQEPESYILTHTDYIPKVKDKLFWEVRVSADKVEIIQRGGPLEPIVLEIKGGNLEVEDWWGWGEG